LFAYRFVNFILLLSKMGEKQVLVASLLAVLITTGVLFYLAPEQNSSNSLKTEEEILKCVARSTIISRGQDWVDKHVPYNQGGSHDGYRTDCSGFVSMCWELSKPGLTTSTMHTASHEISKADLAAGDAILCPGTHIVLFAGWADSTKSHYTGMEEANSSTGTVKRTIPFPYWSDTGCYKPYRSNTVC
jgi:hypothetical protein